MKLGDDCRHTRLDVPARELNVYEDGQREGFLQFVQCGGVANNFASFLIQVPSRGCLEVQRNSQ